jgi:hypothetical protein
MWPQGLPGVCKFTDGRKSHCDYRRSLWNQHWPWKHWHYYGCRSATRLAVCRTVYPYTTSPFLDFQSNSFSRQFLVVLVQNIRVTCPDCRLPTTKISAFGITKVSGPNRCWVRHDVSQGCLSLVQYLAVWCDYFQIVACSRVVVIILVCVALSWFVEQCFSSAVYVGLCKQ